MENIKLGTILEIGGKKYITYSSNSELIKVCDATSSKLDFLSISYQELLPKILNKEINVLENTERPCVDITKFSEEVRKEFSKRKIFINEVDNLCNKQYETLFNKKYKDDINNIIKKYKMSKSKFWRLVRTYIQSGCQIHSLLDKRLLRESGLTYNYKVKTGRPTRINRNQTAQQGVIVNNEIRAYFEEGLKEFKSGRKKTISGAYEDILAKHYMDIEETPNGLTYSLCPPEMRPTLKQFRRFMDSKLTPKDIKIIKSSMREFRNNNRILTGDSLYDVNGPADVVEIDACEVDIKLVSMNDPTQSVSRPTIYIVKDCYTRMIVAYSVSFENNSLRGLTNCLLSLIDDKVEVCKRLGLDVPERFWPSHFIPNKIRTDNGAEFTSYEGQRIFEELNITQDTNPPAMGSLKSLVEQFFHQMHSAQNPLVERKGMISKRYDSKAEEEAVFNIEEIERFITLFIIEQNAKQLTTYPLSKEMIAEGFTKTPTPYELWDFGVAHFGTPRPIENEAQFKFTLLQRLDSSLTRKGITYNGLYWLDMSDHLLTYDINKIKKTSEKYEVRIDSRDVSYVYRLANGRIIRTPLSPKTVEARTFAGWSLPEYETYIEDKNESDKVAEDFNMINRSVRKAKQKELLSKASGNGLKIETKNIKENTKIEKLNRRHQEVIFNDVPEITYEEPEFKNIENKDEEIDLSVPTEIAAQKALESFRARQRKR